MSIMISANKIRKNFSISAEILPYFIAAERLHVVAMLKIPGAGQLAASLWRIGSRQNGTSRNVVFKTALKRTRTLNK